MVGEWVAALRTGTPVCNYTYMALRSPIYLDTETLLSVAEYHDVAVPHQADIVEKTVRRRGAGGKLGTRALGADVSAGSDVEYQSTYSLSPREKATTSKVIDALIHHQAAICNPDEDTALTRDLLLEVEGTTRITAASLAGKMFHILRSLMDDDTDLDTLMSLQADDWPVAERLKAVYLQNQLPPVPILVEMEGSTLPQRLYVNLRPDHFIDSASANRVEGDFRVLGTISGLVFGGDEGYLSAEHWLLYDWEHLMRRKLMVEMEDLVKDLIEKFELDFPAQDVQTYITGPAVIVDAIAVY